MRFNICGVLKILAYIAIIMFFHFPIAWIVNMSFMTNDEILRKVPVLFYEPTLKNYIGLWKGEIAIEGFATMYVYFKQNLINSAILSVGSVSVTLLLGVPAAYAFARYKFKGGDDIAFTLLSFRFAPALLIILPLNLYFSQIGLYDSYFALIWVYQLITLPLLLWIVRGYFEDISPDIEYAYRLDGHSWFQSFWRISIPLAKPGIAAASLLCFIYAWNNFVFALILGSSQIQPVTVGALAFITASAIPYGLIACGIVVSVLPTLILALFIQKYLVQGLSLGAIKG